MTDKPPATALDRLRAGLRRRNTAAPAAADGGQPAPPPADEPPALSEGGPAAIESTPPDEPEPAPSAAMPEPLWPRPDPEIVEMRRLMRVTIDGLKIDHGEQLSRTRHRIHLRWAMAVMLGTAVVAGAGYLYLSHNQEELFQRHWPWRAHVWNNYGGAAIWCINEARKTDGSFTCQVPFLTDGPDCPIPDTTDVTAAYLCPPWETPWPTDPAPRWGPKGPPQWNR